MLRTGARAISSRLNANTGVAVSVAAVGICEPVTMTVFIFMGALVVAAAFFGASCARRLADIIAAAMTAAAAIFLVWNTLVVWSFVLIGLIPEFFWFFCDCVASIPNTGGRARKMLANFSCRPGVEKNGCIVPGAH